MPESYISCHWLEGGLVFQDGFLSVCCTNHSNGTKGCPFICRFDGGELPLDEIFTVRDQLRRNVRDGVDCACTGCPALTHREWPEEKKTFGDIAIANFLHCNLECYYCDNHSPPEKEDGTAVRAAYDVLPIITDLYESGLASSGTSFEWGGGEPTLVSEFEPLLRSLMKRGAPIHINTNATILSPAILEGLAAGRIKNVTCSVDAGTPETYAAIKKRNSFATVWRNLAEYAKANSRAVTVKFILLEENMSREEVAAFIGQCRAGEITRIRISRDTQRPLPKRGVGLSANMIHLALKENMDVDISPGIFGPGDCARMMYYVHQLIVENRSSVDFSRLFKLSHMFFEYLKFNSALNA
jgi:pyruvate-formate lyase-activating enzyme